MEEHLKHTHRRRKGDEEGEGREGRKGEPPPPRRQRAGGIGFNGFHPDGRRRSHGRKGNVDARRVKRRRRWKTRQTSNAQRAKLSI